MAEQGRREVVSDQLAFNAREQAPERSLATMGVRNPGQGPGIPKRTGLASLGALQETLGQVAEGMMDDAITNGKLSYMQGVTEQEILATGNKYTRQGYEALSSIDQANNWFLEEENAILGGADQMSPDEYKTYLMEKRGQALSALPDDPAIKKLYAAAFEDKGPVLIAKQYEAHNAYNEGRALNELSSALSSSSVANSDATRVMPGSSLRVSSERIDTAVMSNEQDRDIGILTMLGEANGEGDVGLAAVAHVIKNRVLDKRWGGTVSSVSKAPKQFSVWNDGGASLAKFRGTAAYNRAAAVYDSVMQGYTTDMTNGATHYYSPKGMKKLVADGAQSNLEPGWLATETKRAGGGIRIGNHIFAGKAGAGGLTPVFNTEVETETGLPDYKPASAGKLTFRHKGQEGIDPGFGGILTEASAALGIPFEIISGHRSESHPVEAAKIAKGGTAGEHAHRDAADINLEGMSDQQRQAVVAELRSRGVKRFGIYKDSPNMLHVDMNAKGGSPDDWFMYDRSNKNMGMAPAWFQQIAASDTGKPLPKGGQTQVRTLLMNSPIRDPAKKGAALARSIIQQLDSGSDQLYNDAGGIGILREFGTPETLIDSVVKAQARMEQKALDSFDLDFERRRQDLFTSIKNGEFSSLAEVQDVVGAMHGEKWMNDKQAQALVRQAATEWEKLSEGEDAVLPKGFQEDITQIVRKVSLGTMTTDEANDEARALGAEYKMDGKTTQRFLNKIYEADTQRFNRDQAEAKTLAEKTLKSNELKAKADTALSNATGLRGLTGKVDAGGKEMEVKDYAIQNLKNSEAKNIKEGILAGQIRQADAESILFKNVYEKLAQQDVVDEVAGNAFAGALTGNIMDKGGKPRQGALEAFDFYMQMQSNPNIPDAYVDKMFKDTGVRALLNEAEGMYSLDLDLETALTKAHEKLNTKDFNKPNIDEQFYANLGYKVETSMMNVMGNSGFWNAVTGQMFADTSPRDRDSILKNSTGPATAYVTDRARRYHSLHPTASPDTVIKMATKDLENNTVAVRGKLVYGEFSKGTRIDQAMGLADMDKSTVDDALDYIIQARGKEMWPDQWDEAAKLEIPGVGTARVASAAPVDVNYNPSTGLISFQLTDKNGVITGATHYMDAKAIGSWYKAKNKSGSFVGRTYDAAADTIFGNARKMQTNADIMEMVAPR